MLERLGRWTRKHREAVCRIGGGIFAGNGVFLGWLLANVSLEKLYSNTSILSKIAILGVDLVMTPFLAIKIADGVSDIITGQHHWLGCKIVDRFDQLRERRNRRLQRTSDPWASEEARLLLEEVRVRHQPTLQVG